MAPASQEAVRTGSGRDRWVVLDSQFGVGLGFLAALRTWRSEPRPCKRLFYLGFSDQAMAAPELAAALEHHRFMDADAQSLIKTWPPQTRNVHHLSFADGAVTLMLHLRAPKADWPDCIADVNAFILHGGDALHDPLRVAKRLQRLAALDATVSVPSAERTLTQALEKSGWLATSPAFEAQWSGRFQPVHPIPKPSGRPRQPQTQAPRHAVIVGAGLAACASAHALAKQGWTSTLLSSGAAPADGASGNVSGLVHSVITPDDGPHARWFRSAALHTQASLARWLAEHPHHGQLQGLARLEPRLTAEQAQALVDRLGLPTEHLQWWSAAQVAQATGRPCASGAWWFVGGGWLDPRALCEHWLRTSAATFKPHATLQCLTATADGFRLHLQDQSCIDASTVILANAHDALRLIQTWWPKAPTWMSAVRGQVTTLAPGLVPAPHAPLAGQGYALGLQSGAVMTGATVNHHDLDPELRADDQAHNLERLGRLLLLDPQEQSRLQDLPLSGRVGWRATTRDRLPLLGALPNPVALSTKDEGQHGTWSRWPRLVGPHGGLYLATGLGSRGLTSASLIGEVMASWITGAPCPIEADLFNSVDVARALAWR